MNISETDWYDVSIAGSDDLGLACGHMESGSTLFFSLTGNREIDIISTTGGDVGGLVGEMENNSVFKCRLNISNESLRYTN